MDSIKFSKPRIRWLFGGFGFHNSEATMLPLMSEEFKEQKVLKVFREISPTYSRVFAGFAEWSQEAMESFADYYDLTFRESGTLLYVVPGRMPIPDENLNLDEYCEKVAEKLEYLVKVRNCTKIRYFCTTNELSCANTYAYLSEHLDIFAELHKKLYHSFRRHGLDIGLIAPDSSGTNLIDQHLPWALENINDITECYCGHLYIGKKSLGDSETYDDLVKTLSNYVLMCRKREKRFILGEYGINNALKWTQSHNVMSNDGSYAVDFPEQDGVYALCVAEVALAAINSGCFSAVFWTMFDYPDPFIRENGDTIEEKARYDVARFSGHGLDIRYNKNGLAKWCDDEKDYGPRAALYTLGYMAKFFRKGSRVLEVTTNASLIRAAAVTNPDGSMTATFINLSDKSISLDVSIEHKSQKPFRKYVYEAANPPYNDFCDLQAHTGTLDAPDGNFEITLPALSMVFLSTDYVERTPSPIANIKNKGGKLTWDKVSDTEHCYYRIFKDKIQIASTVATHINVCDDGVYEVFSVDKHGNCRKPQ